MADDEKNETPEETVEPVAETEEAPVAEEQVPDTSTTDEAAEAPEEEQVPAEALEDKGDLGEDEKPEIAYSASPDEPSPPPAVPEEAATPA